MAHIFIDLDFHFQDVGEKNTFVKHIKMHLNDVLYGITNARREKATSIKTLYNKQLWNNTTRSKTLNSSNFAKYQTA
jgi:GR25 family glycosyltransferase involved in LPS biosynthesis